MTIPDSSQLSSTGQEKLRRLAPDPNALDIEYPDRKLFEICSRLGLPLVALRDHLTAQDHKERDCHWNESGHQRVSELLCNLYRQLALPKTAFIANGRARVIHNVEPAVGYERLTP